MWGLMMLNMSSLLTVSCGIRQQCKSVVKLRGILVSFDAQLSIVSNNSRGTGRIETPQFARGEDLRKERVGSLF
jgi:small nuclear ribonucleoprotein (snRNP)-like protein